MTIKHTKIILGGICAATLIIAIMFLPIIPVAGPPGSLGGGGFTSLANMQLKFPDNQPTSLPVYKVTDFVVLYGDTGDTDHHSTPPTPEQARAWFGKMLKDKYDLPLPEGKFEPDYDTIGDYEKKIITGFTQWNQYIDDMEIYPAVIGARYNKKFNGFGYHGYKLEKVGEIKIQSAQEAYEQIESGNDIGALSRKHPDESTQHYTHTGWQKAAYNTVKLSWYYPPAAEHDWPHTGEYANSDMGVQSHVSRWGKSLSMYDKCS